MVLNKANEETPLISIKYTGNREITVTIGHVGCPDEHYCLKIAPKGCTIKVETPLTKLRCQVKGNQLEKDTKNASEGIEESICSDNLREIFIQQLKKKKIKKTIRKINNGTMKLEDLASQFEITKFSEKMTWILDFINEKMKNGIEVFQDSNQKTISSWNLNDIRIYPYQDLFIRIKRTNKQQFFTTKEKNDFELTEIIRKKMDNNQTLGDCQKDILMKLIEVPSHIITKKELKAGHRRGILKCLDALIIEGWITVINNVVKLNFV